MNLMKNYLKLLKIQKIIWRFKMMLCQSITESELPKYNNSNWIVEQKLDGSRIMLVKQNDKINLISRDNNDYTDKYPQIVEEAKQLPNCVLDGELTFYDNNGNDVFLTSLATKNTIREYGVKPKLMIFDIIELDGVNITKHPLLKRKEILESIFFNIELKEIKLLPYSESPIELWKFVKRNDREGIIIKNKYSLYTMGYRSKMWLKCKNWREAQLVFDGFETMPNNKGITLTNKEGYRVACLGSQSLKVQEMIEREGKVNCRIQYLNKTENNRFRFISYRGVV